MRVRWTVVILPPVVVFVVVVCYMLGIGVAPANPCYGVSFSPDGQYLVATFGTQGCNKWGPPWGGDGEAVVWETQEWQRYATFNDGFTSQAVSPRFSPDGKTLAVGTERFLRHVKYGANRAGAIVRFWDVQTKQELTSLELPTKQTAAVQQICYSPKGDKLFVGRWGWPPLMYDVDSWRERYPLADVAGNASYGSFSSDGKFLVTSSAPDGVVRVHDANTGKTLAVHEFFPPSTPNATRLDQTCLSVDFAPSGKEIAVANAIGDVYVFSVDLKDKPRLTKIGTKYIHGLMYSPDGKALAVTQEESVWVLDPESLKVLKQLRDIGDTVNSVAFSPDSKLLAIGCGKDAPHGGTGTVGKVLVYSWPEGKLLKTLRP